MGRPLPYTKPVSRLLSLGDTGGFGQPASNWPNYLEQYGLTERDADELIRLASDRRLHQGQCAPYEAGAEWAPVYAWRALGQMRCAEAVVQLIDTLGYCLKMYDDSGPEEIPMVLALIGPPALKPIGMRVQNAALDSMLRVCLTGALKKLAQQHPETRDSCLTYLRVTLQKYDRNPRDVNGFLISALCDLADTDSMPLIEAAYRADAVDTMIIGNLDQCRATMFEHTAPSPAADARDD